MPEPTDLIVARTASRNFINNKAFGFHSCMICKTVIRNAVIRLIFFMYMHACNCNFSSKSYVCMSLILDHNILYIIAAERASLKRV